MRVSRQHARVHGDAGRWKLEDLGSNNGTYINDTRVQGSAPLKHEDEILIANNRIRVEARDSTPEPQFPPGAGVTVIEVGATNLIRSREDSGSGRNPLISSGLISIADQRAVRLLERKLDALTSVLQATASSDNAEALLEKIVEALLELFPQAEDVGVLVEDERSG